MKILWFCLFFAAFATASPRGSPSTTLSLSDLPNELLMRIALEPKLKERDIASLGMTSKALYNVLNLKNANFARNKYLIRFKEIVSISLGFMNSVEKTTTPQELSTFTSTITSFPLSIHLRPEVKQFWPAFFYKAIRLQNVGLIRWLCEPANTLGVISPEKGLVYAQRHGYGDSTDALLPFVTLSNDALDIIAKKSSEAQQEFYDLHRTEGYKQRTYLNRFRTLAGSGYVDINVFGPPNERHTNFGSILTAISEKSLPALKELILFGTEVDQTYYKNRGGVLTKVSPIVTSLSHGMRDFAEALAQMGASICTDEVKRKIASFTEQSHFRYILQFLKQHTFTFTDFQDELKLYFYNVVRSGELDRFVGFVEFALSRNLRFVRATGTPTDIVRQLSEDETNRIRLLLQEIDTSNQLIPNHHTLLAYAVQSGSSAMVETLLRFSADPNSRFANDPSPICQAIQLRRFDLNKLLLSFNANPNVICQGGKSALTFALMRASTEMTVDLLHHGADINSVLGPNGDKLTVLHYLSGRFPSESLRTILLGRVSVNIVDDHGNNALHFAIRRQDTNIDVVKDLISRGCSFTQKNVDGRTPFHFAVRYLQKEAAKVLLEAGTDVNEKDRQSRTSLDYLNERILTKTLEENVQLVATAKVLVDHGLNLNGLTVKDSTILHDLALESTPSHLENLSLLLDAGLLDVDVPSSDGTTPLQLAAEHKNIEYSKMLVKYGARIEPRNQEEVAFYSSLDQE